MMRREVAEFSDNSKITKYPSKYRGKFFRKIGNTGVSYVRHTLSVSFPSVSVCLNTASLDYGKIIQDSFMVVSLGNSRLLCSIIKPYFVIIFVYISVYVIVQMLWLSTT